MHDADADFLLRYADDAECRVRLYGTSSAAGAVAVVSQSRREPGAPSFVAAATEIAAVLVERLGDDFRYLEHHCRASRALGGCVLNAVHFAGGRLFRRVVDAEEVLPGVKLSTHPLPDLLLARAFEAAGVHATA